MPGRGVCTVRFPTVAATSRAEKLEANYFGLKDWFSRSHGAPLGERLQFLHLSMIATTRYGMPIIRANWDELDKIKMLEESLCGASGCREGCGCEEKKVRLQVSLGKFQNKKKCI